MVGLYLYDSAVLLASNEVILSPRQSGRWVVMFGADSFQLRGKEPFMPNPLLPHHPIFRLSWNVEGLVGPCRPWSPPCTEYGVLVPYVWLMFLALFFVIPLGLFSNYGHGAIAAGIALFYLCAIAALIVAWIKRADFGLSQRRFASLALECLTCPPFAVNLIRHLSLGVRPREDFLVMIDQCLAPSERDAALSKVISRVRNEIDWEEEGSPRSRSLNAHLQFLCTESNTCRALNS